jgi:PTH1 family peptidyl-tRNA hydrolase
VRAIIGLGNPGSEYDGTRHNIGFAVLDELAAHYKIGFRAGRGEYSYATNGDCLLVKPMTYMNNSGIAVKEVLDWFKLAARDLLVVFDDFHLPLGSLRLREKGSPAGHNGLASIIWHLNSDEFPRLRCGIGHETNPADKADFVLSRFDRQELETVQKMVAAACDIAVIAAEQDFRSALDHLSRKKV